MPEDADKQAIRSLVERQFASLSWTERSPADWAAFASDFVPGASLFPSARPLSSRSVDAFVDRMKGLAGTTLRSLQERLLGIEVRTFGNVGVAVAACELVGNDAEISRSVEMLLLVKDAGIWRIASQAWDVERGSSRIPDELLSLG